MNTYRHPCCLSFRRSYPPSHRSVKPESLTVYPLKSSRILGFGVNRREKCYSRDKPILVFGLCIGFRVSGFGFRVSGLGFRLYGVWCMVYGVWYMVYGVGVCV